MTWGVCLEVADARDGVGQLRAPKLEPRLPEREEFFIDNLLVRIHSIIVMIGWAGLAPWKFEFPFPACQKDIESCFYSSTNPSTFGVHSHDFSTHSSTFGALRP